MINNDAKKYLGDYYGNHDEDGRLVSRVGNVEYLTTMRYIEKYLKPGDRILEIGAATGRYSHALARAGYRVDAVELIEHNIEIFERNTLSGEEITVRQGDALDLSDFQDDAYDITLLLGPLYHMYNQADKRRAVGEAVRVTRPGGVIFAAHVITDNCILDTGFRRGAFSIAEYIERGLINPETFAARSEPKEIFELVRIEDIDELMAVFPVKRLHYVATDGFAQCMREELDAMDAATYELYLKYHFATCERPDMAGMTSHSLDIFKK